MKRIFCDRCDQVIDADNHANSLRVEAVLLTGVKVEILVSPRFSDEKNVVTEDTTICKPCIIEMVGLQR